MFHTGNEVPKITIKPHEPCVHSAPVMKITINITYNCLFLKNYLELNMSKNKIKKNINVIIHFEDKKISRIDELLSKVKLFLLLSEMKLENDLKENKITQTKYETLIKQHEFMINYIDCKRTHAMIIGYR